MRRGFVSEGDTNPCLCDLRLLRAGTCLKDISAGQKDERVSEERVARYVHVGHFR
jgi:hypothetical protein